MVAVTKNKANLIAPKLVRLRHWIQAAFLLVWLDPFLLRIHSVCSPVFHCYSCPLALFACPIGVIANFSALHVIPFVAIGTLVLVGALVGSLVCGWACPFGFLQDLIGKIPVPKVNLPMWTRHIRYVVLVALVLVIPYLYGEGHPLFFCRVCPAGALEGAIPNVARLAINGEPIVWPSALKLTIVTIVVLAMFVKWRPWCWLFCPLGAIFGLFNRFSVIFLRFRPERCSGCRLSDAMCRYGVLPDNPPNDPQCIRCMECTRCPAISLETAFGRKKEESEEPEESNLPVS